VKRQIGRFLVVGLLSGGAMSVAASPSSAARDNRCMDEANYNSQVQWYEDQWDASYDSLEAWANAVHYVNPLSGEESWEASYSGGTHTVLSGWDYQQQLGYWSNQVGHWDDALSGFLDTWSVCP
jgi:hypothetical protein